MNLDLGSGFHLRPATQSDLPAFRRVCLKTGDAGEDATHLHDDPELIGDFFTVPYVILEPEHAFTVEGPSGVVGYVLGALDTAAFYERLEREWLVPLRERVADPGADESEWSGSDWVRDLVFRPNLAIPSILAPYPSHAHIDLLREARGRGIGRRAFSFLMDVLAAAGSSGVHLHVNPRNERAIAFYRRLSFSVLQPLPDSFRNTCLMGRLL